MNSTQMSTKTAAVVWLLLIIASLATTWVGDHNLIFAQWGAVIVMLVAAFKTRLILSYYMELRSAPLILRLSYDAWILLTTAITLYLWLTA